VYKDPSALAASYASLTAPNRKMQDMLHRRAHVRYARPTNISIQSNICSKIVSLANKQKKGVGVSFDFHRTLMNRTVLVRLADALLIGRAALDNDTAFDNEWSDGISSYFDRASTHKGAFTSNEKGVTTNEKSVSESDQDSPIH